jgi:chromosomal replication initiation ATPase DnaA
MTQLALDLSLPPGFLASDFLEAECNREAAYWIGRWPAWPDFALALCGPAGSGKSHLAHIFAAHSGAEIIPARELTVALVGELAEDAGAVIEDADRGVDETALFHLYNLLKEQHRPLLLTGRQPPNHWEVRLPDLKSRLATLTVASIGAPDDGLLQALLVKLFADRQVRIGPEIIAYLLPRMERSFAAVRALVERLDQEALRQGRAITLPLIRSLIA